MSQAKRNFPWWARIALLALAVGAAGVGMWILFSPAVPPQKYRRLREGMTGGEVLELLGKPLQVNRKTGGRSEWIYGTPSKRSKLRVDFSQDEHVIRYRDNGLKIGVIKGVYYWGATQVFDQIGASEKAREMKFKEVCASMGWEGLQYRCKDETDAKLLDAEIHNFFNAQGYLIPNYNAWSQLSETKGALRNVIVTNSSKVLEAYLRERGYNAE